MEGDGSSQPSGSRDGKRVVPLSIFLSKNFPSVGQTRGESVHILSNKKLAIYVFPLSNSVA